MCRAPSLLLLGLLLPLAPLAAGERDPTPTRQSGPRSARLISSGLEEEVLVRRVLWPVRIASKHPDGCAGLSASQLEVLEDGVSIPVDAIERSRLDTIHAVVIDTSSSMRGRLERAKRAAGRYIRELPGDEPVLLATFSDNLVLHSPLTTDREALERALERIEIGFNTAFHDALYYMIRYLASRPERKVIIALTDGCDNASLRLHPFQRVLELAEQAENLTVFPVGVDFPRGCERSSIKSLERLGRRSGGTLFRLRDAAGLSRIFQEIHTRLGQEGYIAYRPLPFGLGPRDREGRKGYRKRRVEIRSKLAGSCNVTSAGPAVRIEGRHPDATQDLLDSLELRLPFRTRLRLPYGETWAVPPGAETSYLYLEPAGVRGRTADILAERRARLAPSPSMFLSRYRIVPAQFGVRDFSLRVPPFAALKDSLNSPESLLLYLLELELRPFEWRAARAASQMSPSWVHGQTFLDIRRFLGQALYSYSGYREWANEQLRVERRAEMEQLLADYLPTRQLPVDQVVEATIQEQGYTPEPAHLQRYLGEWLGDVTARDLVVALERMVANRLLMPPGPGGEADRVLQLIDSRWAELAEWFHLPARVRIITPLIPGFDPERSVVGFYRVVLPRLNEAGPREDLVPEAALALRFTRWLLESDPDGSSIRGWVTLKSIDYVKPAKRNKRQLRKQAPGGITAARRWRGLRAVALELGPRDEAGPTVRLTAYYLDTGKPGPEDRIPAPLCAQFEEPAAAGEHERIRAIREVIVASGRECGLSR